MYNMYTSMRKMEYCNVILTLSTIGWHECNTIWFINVITNIESKFKYCAVCTIET